MTKHGFDSSVQKKAGEFHIRARVRRDLENLVVRLPLIVSIIHTSKDADYGLALPKLSAELALRRVSYQFAVGMCLPIFSVEGNGRVKWYKPEHKKNPTGKI